MRPKFHFAIAILLLCCCVFSTAQTSAPPTEKKPNPPIAFQDEKHIGPVEILNDTMGVDFSSYLRQFLLPTVRKNWLNLIPEEARAPLRKKGKVVIEFAVLKHGSVAAMKLASTSGDVALDRAAWGGVTASDPFPPLPSEFVGRYLRLRFTFYYNPDKGEVPASPNSTSNSGITVNIFPHPVVRVTVGGSEVVTATVAGTTNKAVDWNITGAGCSGSACGAMSGSLYLAPSVLPNPPSVLLTASSQADSTASASVTIQLVQHDSSGTSGQVK